jgi:hypothetical protein
MFFCNNCTEKKPLGQLLVHSLLLHAFGVIFNLHRMGQRVFSVTFPRQQTNCALQSQKQRKLVNKNHLNNVTFHPQIQKPSYLILQPRPLAFVKAAQRFDDKLSVARMLNNDQMRVTKISSNNSNAIKFLPCQLLHLQHDGFVTKLE